MTLAETRTAIMVLRQLAAFADDMPEEGNKAHIISINLKVSSLYLEELQSQLADKDPQSSARETIRRLDC